MNFYFDGEVWYWRGPAPWYFVTVPEPISMEINTVSRSVSYGWGMIPVTAEIGKTRWQTAMFPKDGRYILPLKAKVRTAEKILEGDWVSILMEVDQV